MPTKYFVDTELLTLDATGDWIAAKAEPETRVFNSFDDAQAAYMATDLAALLQLTALPYSHPSADIGVSKSLSILYNTGEYEVIATEDIYGCDLAV